MRAPTKIFQQIRISRVTKRILAYSLYFYPTPIVFQNLNYLFLIFLNGSSVGEYKSHQQNTRYVFRPGQHSAGRIIIFTLLYHTPRV